MKLPHAIATDSAGHLFVADRDNARIVLFDRDGRFLANWAQFGAPSGLYITPDDTLYVAAIGEQSGVVIGSARSGEVRGRVAMPSKGVNGPHLILRGRPGRYLRRRPAVQRGEKADGRAVIDRRRFTRHLAHSSCPYRNGSAKATTVWCDHVVTSRREGGITLRQLYARFGKP